MNILVTGPNGNIGSVLVKQGAIPSKVWFGGNKSKKLKSIETDLARDMENIRTELETVRPDIVIHTASKSSPDWCEVNRQEAINVNVRYSYCLAIKSCNKWKSARKGCRINWNNEFNL